MGEKRTISSFADSDFDSFASGRLNGSRNSSTNEASIMSCMSSAIENKECRQPKDTIDTEYKAIARNGYWRGSFSKRTRISYSACRKDFEEKSMEDKGINGYKTPTSSSQPECAQEKSHRPVVSLTEVDILNLTIDEESEDDDLAGLEFVSDSG
mmetsp:Transcript_18407/g.37188  ORF Transcript_18407/g.37188 Transcript_18407/m.37188 type:complete len:154 (-) Transcript_18407:17-478(-)